MPKLLDKMLAAAKCQMDSAVHAVSDCHYAATLAGHLDLHETTDVNPYGSSVWFMPKVREDVEKLMTLCPEGKFWAKRSSDASIVYEVTLDDGKVLTIYASEDALPPTCEVEEVDVTIPAQPERVEKKRVLKCKPGATTASVPGTEDIVAVAVTPESSPSF